MSLLPRTLERVLETPTRLARVTEFLFRRADAAGDIYPEDDDHGVIPGPDPDRVLVFGEPGMISLGVRTHELSLAGFFAREHHAATHRGVAWNIHTLKNARLQEACAAVEAVDEELRRTDIVVLLVGISDALRVVGAATWEDNLRDTLDALTASLCRDARIVIAEIPPLDNAGSLSRAARTAAGIHGTNLNRHTRKVALDYPAVTAAPFPDELTQSLWRPESEENRYTATYRIWAAHLAHHVTT